MARVNRAIMAACVRRRSKQIWSVWQSVALLAERSTLTAAGVSFAAASPPAARARRVSPRLAHLAAAMLVFKLLTPAENAAFLAAGSTRGSARDVADGYVHLSTAATLPGTLSKHYAGEPRVHLLAFDSERLCEALRWEPARGGTLFPHLYGELRTAGILWARDLDAVDGVHVLPPEAQEGAE